MPLHTHNEAGTHVRRQGNMIPGRSHKWGSSLTMIPGRSHKWGSSLTMIALSQMGQLPNNNPGALPLLGQLPD